MGKNSKRRAGKKQGTGTVNSTARPTSASNGTATSATDNGSIPRQRLLHPEDWATNVACLHPFARPDLAFFSNDAERYIDKQDGLSQLSRTKIKSKLIENYSDCPICFQSATLTCARCGTVSYCSVVCQRKHWKLSHGKACQPNPNLYKHQLRLDTTFQGLSEDCFAGHEFLVVKPSEQLQSLEEICNQVLEPADDLFDIPGFGANQMNLSWLLGNQSHHTYQSMVHRFGWASGSMGHELVYGYRVAEARVTYFLWCDDSFQARLDLDPNYYARGLFPPLPQGKHVRGNVVVYKAIIKNKRIESNSSNQQNLMRMMMQMTDDADLKYEFVLQPMNKAELAYMLQERSKAIDQGASTSRMWRYHIRRQEMLIEATNNNQHPGLWFVTV